jgi:hypothetical protein
MRCSQSRLRLNRGRNPLSEPPRNCSNKPSQLFDRYAAYPLTMGTDPDDVQKFRTGVATSLNTLTPEQDEAILRDGGFSHVPAVLHRVYLARLGQLCLRGAPSPPGRG